MELDSSSDDYNYDGGAAQQTEAVANIKKGVFKRTNGDLTEQQKAKDVFKEAFDVFEIIFNKLFSYDKQYLDVLRKMVKYTTSQQLFQMFIKWNENQIAFPSVVSQQAGALNKYIKDLQDLSTTIPEVRIISRKLLTMQGKINNLSKDQIISKYDKNNLDKNQEILLEIIKGSTDNQNVELIKIQSALLQDKKQTLTAWNKMTHQDIQIQQRFQVVIDSYIKMKEQLLQTIKESIEGIEQSAKDLIQHNAQKTIKEEKLIIKKYAKYINQITRFQRAEPRALVFDPALGIDANGNHNLTEELGVVGDGRRFLIQDYNRIIRAFVAAIIERVINNGQEIAAAVNINQLTDSENIYDIIQYVLKLSDFKMNHVQLLQKLIFPAIVYDYIDLRVVAGNNALQLHYYQTPVPEDMNQFVVFYLCQQALNAIYALNIIQFERFKDGQHRSFGQLLGGRAKRAHKVIEKTEFTTKDQEPESKQDQPKQGAEMLYMLFSQITRQLNEIFSFHAAPNADHQFRFDLQIPFNSKFKDAYEYITTTQNINTDYQFQHFCYLMNKIWNSYSGLDGSIVKDNVNNRTKTIIQDYFQQILQTITFAESITNNINNTPGLLQNDTYNKILNTTGFTRNSGVEEQKINIHVDDMEDNIIKERYQEQSTFNTKYQKFISFIEQFINDRSKYYFDDTSIYKHFISQYYNNDKYKTEATRRIYILEQFVEFQQNNTMNTTIIKNFKEKFYVQFYYYQIYISYIMQQLYNYHHRYVDATVNLCVDNFNNHLIYNAHDLLPPNQEHVNNFDITVAMLVVFAQTYQPPVAVAAGAPAPIDDFQTILFRRFNTIMAARITDPVLNQIIADQQELGHAEENQNNVNLSRNSFLYKLLNRIILNNAAQEINQRTKDVLIFKLKQQFNYLTSQQNIMAFVMQFIFSNITFVNDFIQALGDRASQVFTQITDTTQIDQITEFLVESPNGALNNQMAVIYQDNEYPNLQLDGAHNVFYLNKQYADILKNVTYPAYIYPIVFNDFQQTVDSMVGPLYGVSYRDNKFDYSQLMNYIQQLEHSILGQKQIVDSDEQFVKEFYDEQMKFSLNNSGLINAVFVHKISPPINEQVYDSEIKAILLPDERLQIGYQFDIDGTNKTIQSYEQIRENESTTALGQQIIQTTVQADTYHVANIVVDQQIYFTKEISQIVKLNNFLQQWIQIFSVDNTIDKFPKAIIDKLMNNSTLSNQCVMQQIDYKEGGVKINIPINAFQTPLIVNTGTNMNQRDVKYDNINEQLHAVRGRGYQGGVILGDYSDPQVPTAYSENYKEKGQEQLVPKTLIETISYCHKYLHQNQIDGFAISNMIQQRRYQQLFQEYIAAIKRDIADVVQMFQRYFRAGVLPRDQRQQYLTQICQILQPHLYLWEFIDKDIFAAADQFQIQLYEAMVRQHLINNVNRENIGEFKPFREIQNQFKSNMMNQDLKDAIIITNPALAEDQRNAMIERINMLNFYIQAKQFMAVTDISQYISNKNVDTYMIYSQSAKKYIENQAISGGKVFTFERGKSFGEYVQQLKNVLNSILSTAKIEGFEQSINQYVDLMQQFIAQCDVYRFDNYAHLDALMQDAGNNTYTRSPMYNNAVNAVNNGHLIVHNDAGLLYNKQNAIDSLTIAFIIQTIYHLISDRFATFKSSDDQYALVQLELLQQYVNTKPSLYFYGFTVFDFLKSIGIQQFNNFVNILQNIIQTQTQANNNQCFVNKFGYVNGFIFNQYIPDQLAGDLKQAQVRLLRLEHNAAMQGANRALIMVAVIGNNLYNQPLRTQIISKIGGKVNYQQQQQQQFVGGDQRYTKVNQLFKLYKLIKFQRKLNQLMLFYKVCLPGESYQILEEQIQNRHYRMKKWTGNKYNQKLALMQRLVDIYLNNNASKDQFTLRANVNSILSQLYDNQVNNDIVSQMLEDIADGNGQAQVFVGAGNRQIIFDNFYKALQLQNQGVDQSRNINDPLIDTVPFEQMERQRKLRQQQYIGSNTISFPLTTVNQEIGGFIGDPATDKYWRFDDRQGYRRQAMANNNLPANDDDDRNNYAAYLLAQGDQDARIGQEANIVQQLKTNRTIQHNNIIYFGYKLSGAYIQNLRQINGEDLTQESKKLIGGAVNDFFNMNDFLPLEFRLFIAGNNGIGDDDKKTLLQSAIDDHNKQQIKRIIDELNKSALIYDPTTSKIKPFNDQKFTLTDFSNTRLIYSSIAYAFSKSSNQEYTPKQKLQILSRILETDILQRIQESKQFFTNDQQQIISHIYSITNNFLESNFQEIVVREKEKIYNPLSDQYKYRFQTIDSLFNIGDLLNVDNEANRDRYLWLCLEIYNKLKNSNAPSDITTTDWFKNIYYRLFKLIKRQEHANNIALDMPIQRAKLLFVRFQTHNSPFLGDDHYFHDHNVLQYIHFTLLNHNQDGEVQNIDVNNIQDIRFKLRLMKKKTDEFFIDNISKYYFFLSRGLLKQNYQFQIINDILRFDRKYIQQDAAQPFTQDNIVQKRALGIDLDQLTFANVFKNQIVLQNSLYYYKSARAGNQDNKINPILLSYYIQDRGGITEKDILKSASTFGCAISPTAHPEQFANNLYQTLLYEKPQEYHNDQQSQLQQFLRFLNINPINPLVLIKQNISYPVINILSLYMKKKLAEDMHLQAINVDQRVAARVIGHEDADGRRENMPDLQALAANNLNNIRPNIDNQAPEGDNDPDPNAPNPQWLNPHQAIVGGPDIINDILYNNTQTLATLMNRFMYSENNYHLSSFMITSANLPQQDIQQLVFDEDSDVEDNDVV